MTIKEVLLCVGENLDLKALYREVLFWRAYEQVAYSFGKHLKAFR
jgi:hypothetical protein